MTDISNMYAPGVAGCSDGGCILSPPKGMHTNGGCRCAVKLRMAAGDIGWDVEKTIHYLRSRIKSYEAQIEELENDAAIGRMVRLKMTSGNSVPADRCIVTAAEIDAAISNMEAIND